jgi:S-adenosylmethionine hydrolase
VAPDNGVLALALKDEPPIEIIHITQEKYFLKPVSDTFHGRDIFAPVAAYLSKGEPIENFGKRIKSFKELELPVVKHDVQNLIGEVIYIDRFGNLVTNIDRDLLRNFIKKEDFTIHIAEKVINKISHAYSQVKSQEPLALIDSFNYLEIAINCGSAQDYFGVGIGEKISIKK